MSGRCFVVPHHCEKTQKDIIYALYILMYFVHNGEAH